jgi:hypothetical protein
VQQNLTVSELHAFLLSSKSNQEDFHCVTLELQGCSSRGNVIRARAREALETSLPRTLAQLMLARSREVEIHNAFTHVFAAFTVCSSHRIKVRRCAIFSRQQGTLA